mmetsp:Transcript_22244/g.48640  ORF Transcript_22244/g.48640 Transcript_22244/m.48640 type:complete len:255 (-) Transcript_22244:332-1096(-)
MNRKRRRKREQTSGGHWHGEAAAADVDVLKDRPLQKLSASCSRRSSTQQWAVPVWAQVFAEAWVWERLAADGWKRGETHPLTGTVGRPSLDAPLLTGIVGNPGRGSPLLTGLVVGCSSWEPGDSSRRMMSMSPLLAEWGRSPSDDAAVAGVAGGVGAAVVVGGGTVGQESTGIAGGMFGRDADEHGDRGQNGDCPDCAGSDSRSLAMTPHHVRAADCGFHPAAAVCEAVARPRSPTCLSPFPPRRSPTPRNPAA